MSEVFVTGATGFIGGHLVSALLGRGERVTVLGRDVDRMRARFGEDVSAVAWDPETPQRGAWQDAIEGQHAVVHLAGEPVVGARWTESVKERLAASRVETTRAVVDAMARAKRKPRVFVSASGVGYYGHQPASVELDEKNQPGSDFLAQLCVRWEEQAARAEEQAIRVVRLRIGIVLGADGGALAEMIKPFKLFAGGPIGSGEQIVSWIHIDDVIRIVLRAIDDESLAGPVNVTTPNAVSNRELAKAIGRALHRPSWISAPAFALRARFGEGADPLLTGQRAVPRALLEHGYSWLHPEIDAALAASLGGS